jgi:hypothetical protein
VTRARDGQGFEIDGRTFVVRGRLVKTASLKDEWAQDVPNPVQVIDELRSSWRSVDLLTFWQRPPDTAPMYPYYHEYVDVAALPITTFGRWWNNQISTKTRNMARKPVKRGVVIAEAGFTDDLVAGITAIFNESPVRRGKRFKHYGKGIEDTRRELSDQLERSIFITASFEGELIAFFKLLQTDRFAMLTMILDKIVHRDKSPINGLIAKAVEICAGRGIPYLTYTVWRRGSHGEFQERNGFDKMRVPRYYVPLSSTGRLALAAGLHNGVTQALPDWLYERLLAVRAGWYRRASASGNP